MLLPNIIFWKLGCPELLQQQRVWAGKINSNHFRFLKVADTDAVVTVVLKWTGNHFFQFYQPTLHAPSIKRGRNTYFPLIYMCAGEKKVPKISLCCVMHLTPKIVNKLVVRGQYWTQRHLIFYSHTQFSSTTFLYKAV